MSKIKINEIPAGRNLTGYLWMSNEQEPRVLENASIEQNNESHKDAPALLEDGVNPFIAEAELWDAEARISYAIHHAGNEIICQRYEVKAEDISNTDNNEVVFLSHRMNGRKLYFLEYWKPQNVFQLGNIKGEQENEAMPTLVMAFRAFVGFRTLKDKEEQK